METRNHREARGLLQNTTGDRYNNLTSFFSMKGMWLLWCPPAGSFAPAWCRKSRNSGLARALRGIPAERHPSTAMIGVVRSLSLRRLP